MSSSEDAPSLEPDGPYVSFVRQRRSAILERLGGACARAGRDVASVTLAAVSKTVGPVEAVAAMRAGYEVFAENRPQELVRKLDALAAAGIEAPRFDMIGNLQKNKINQVLGRASLIQSISSATLAQAVSKRAEREGEGFLRDRFLRESILVPVLLHGFWDFSLSVDSPWMTAAFYAFVLVFFLSANHRLRAASEDDQQL